MISPVDALKRLKNGYNIFSQSTIKTLTIKLGPDEIAKLQNGQHPYAIVITCSDSRVEPNLVFNAGLSELFVVKTAGNIIDSIGLGTVEYALEQLNVPLIVVLGHENCGAVNATLTSLQSRTLPNNFQGCLIKAIQPAVKRVLCSNRRFCNSSIHSNENLDLLNKSIIENIKLTCTNLFRSDLIKQKFNSKQISIVCARYNLNGTVTFLDNLI